ncbi:hypothetical protein U9M48_028590 [Paspalum notatum var. saurae]|uniref:Uncharacterized protein n=1 Tax=Paspalum notatum var. saurae TaxID=547442 RepID=A0AAQ3TVT2_PASNO
MALLQLPASAHPWRSSAPAPLPGRLLPPWSHQAAAAADRPPLPSKAAGHLCSTTPTPSSTFPMAPLFFCSPHCATPPQGSGRQSSSMSSCFMDVAPPTSRQAAGVLLLVKPPQGRPPPARGITPEDMSWTG